MSIKILDSFVETGPKTRFIDDEGCPIYAYSYYPVINTESGQYAYKCYFEWLSDAQDVLYHIIDEGLINLSEWVLRPSEKGLTLRLV